MSDGEPIYAFPVDREFLFKHYFERGDLFDRLAGYYDHDEYRFAVPANEWAGVATTLREHGYDPGVVDEPEDFVVVVERYEPHAAVLRTSLADWTRRGHRFFLQPDPLAVERAVHEHGATPVTETDMVAGI